MARLSSLPTRLRLEPPMGLHSERICEGVSTGDELTLNVGDTVAWAMIPD